MRRSFIVGDQTSIDVSLEEAAEALDEIIVTGYGTETKRETTGAISTVKAKDLLAIPSGNIEQQAIDGRVMVKLANRSQEETFQKEFRKLGVVLNHPRGLWADLSVHDHYFE